MKILVAGAAGFIGSKLFEELLARGDNVAQPNPEWSGQSPDSATSRHHGTSII